jgi:ribonuclease HII
MVAGVDEAGRGPLAGPVAAAAVILDPRRPIQGLADSKRLTPARREALEIEILENSVACSVAFVDVEQIDRVNILQATLLAMRRAVEGLGAAPQQVLVDGDRCPELTCQVQSVIGGDASVPAISAASILAKVARDREMLRLDRLYPGYGFSRNKGYATGEHRAALHKLGPCAIHRRSYRPVRELP